MRPPKRNPCWPQLNPNPHHAGKIYSFNEGNYQLWTDEQRTYIDSLKDPSLVRGSSGGGGSGGGRGGAVIRRCSM